MTAASSLLFIENTFTLWTTSYIFNTQSYSAKYNFVCEYTNTYLKPAMKQLVDIWLVQSYRFSLISRKSKRNALVLLTFEYSQLTNITWKLTCRFFFLVLTLLTVSQNVRLRNITFFMQAKKIQQLAESNIKNVEVQLTFQSKNSNTV